ncbi:MAG: WD40/YVTN/BNR-like repeat-containing protein, partial [Nitrososphaerales archaeon]
TSTWSPVLGQPSFAAASTPLAPLQARLSPDGSIYILYGDQAGPNFMNTGQLWEFTPGSNWVSGTWKQITLPNQNLTINDSNGYGGIAVDPSHAGYLLLSTLDQYWATGDVVYYSTDDGASWRDVSSHTTPGLPYSVSPNLATHDDSIAPWFGPADALTTGNWVTALAIDPFNADHAMYSTGGMLWATTNLTTAAPSANSTGIVDWTIGASGIEETAVEGLWAPPSGETILLSSIGDVYGFAHQNLTAAPQANFTNPAATPTSMDFEQNTPTTVVRVTDGNHGVEPLGVSSTDGGQTWTAFAAIPPGSEGGGVIAIAPDGSSIVWATEDTASVWYSKDGGLTWTPSTGISPQAQVVSDRVQPGVFYGFSKGTLSLSTDGGATFTTVQSGLPGNGVLSVLPDAQGDLWLSGQSSGLYSNSGSATSPNLTAVAGIQDAFHLGFGKTAPGSTRPTLFLDGQIGGQGGLYRSTDDGATWIQINDAAHQWGGIGPVCGDMRTFGTVYLGTEGGRGIIWGTSEN